MSKSTISRYRNCVDAQGNPDWQKMPRPHLKSTPIQNEQKFTREARRFNREFDRLQARLAKNAERRWAA